ncbi:hypothetical protein TRFO_22936 [Tritrichomonas foetus]|uniref:CWH43-like N-terminal domain-containing protein n=1 Tax=Tritrichomonas foetus TaxID=1144522 RepID=A0A1J4KBB7_9EUKA|nr:hypothetical protein TRFO_22936 [Tritrichomonas foetus]|eukprot:OHT08515.1 hypothetical protein TRFO_22936 [Tritrichomonas foetus]
MKLPESRIFAVTINIEVIILAIIFYIRQSLISQGGEKKQLNKSKLFILGKCISSLLATITCVSLSVLSVVTLEDHKKIHLIFSAFFFLSILLYFIVSDIIGKKVIFNVRTFSFLLPYLTIVIVIVYISIIYKIFGNSKKKMKNYGAIMQYIGSFLIFLKVMLVGYDLPPSSIVVGSLSHVKTK